MCSSDLIFVSVTITCIWTFSNIMTEHTTLIENPLGMRFVVLSLPLPKDLPEALDDESHLLIVKLGGVDSRSLAWYSFLLFFHCLKRQWVVVQV